MARSPLQIIVIPYRKTPTESYEFALFHRADGSMWQFVAGGAEDNETAMQAAMREAEEEAGISPDCRWTTLDARASIPRTAFSPTSHWPKDILVVPEFSYAVDVTGYEILLCQEHDEFRWLTFEEATNLLTWDSNRVALWELHEKLSGST